MTKLTNLTELFEQSLSYRRQLVDALTCRAPKQATLYSLPSELQTRPLHRFEKIDVDEVTGSAAHLKVANTLLDIKRRTEDVQSQRVRRYPGLVRYDESIDIKTKLQSLTQSVECFKDELHRLTATATNKQDLRFELLHQLAPNLITMHFYRTPYIIPKVVSRVRFGWVAKRIVSKTDKQTILAKLNNSLNNPGKQIHDFPAWQENVAREIRSITAVPQSVRLRIDRSGGLRPTAFIHYADGSRAQTPANLPILLTQKEDVTIEPLPSWEQQAFPKPKGEQLIARLHLYRID